jgi:hypothetical protein
LPGSAQHWDLLCEAFALAGMFKESDRAHARATELSHP